MKPMRLLCLLCLLVEGELIEYQRMDGWMNSILFPRRGAVFSSILHTAPSDYNDGIASIANDARPDPGLLSDLLLAGPDGLPPFQNRSALFAFFGQAVSGEILSTISSGEISCPAEPRPFKAGHFAEACTIINGTVHDCDKSKLRTIPFFRVAFDPKSGHHVNNPRKPTNFATSWIDGSFIYGTSTVWCNSLRAFKDGELKLNKHGMPLRNEEDVPMLNPPSPHHHPQTMNSQRIYVTGSAKSNQEPLLLTSSVLFHRWHNHQARIIKQQHGNWSDEQIFQRAKQWVVAAWQKIIIYDYLPVLIGEKLPAYTEYQPHVDPVISVEFQTSAFRMGHSLLPSGFFVWTGSGCNFTPHSLCKTWWDASTLVDEYGVDGIIRGLISQKAERADHIFANAVKDNVFGGKRMTHADLPALNIQRGREEGVADFNTVRQAFELEPISNWTNINPDLFKEEPQLLVQLKQLYEDDISRLDLLIGGLLEMKNGLPGETFKAIIMDQFSRIRVADRFWFENKRNGLFNDTEITDIKSLSMRSIIVITTNLSTGQLPPDVFRHAHLAVHCPQPYQLNISVLEPCGQPKTIDFFEDSQWSFVFIFVALSAVPFLCVIFGALIHEFNDKRKLKDKPNRAAGISFGNTPGRLKRKSTMRLKDTFLAYEYDGPKCRQTVQVKLGPGPFIQTHSRSARCMRTIDIQYIDVINLRVALDSKNEFPIVFNLPKDYDMILIFDGILDRSEFINAVHDFGKTLHKPVDDIFVTTENLFSGVMTKSQRYELLEHFFHTAFDQVFHAKRGSGPEADSGARAHRGTGMTSLSRSVAGSKDKNLLAIELNKQEFAKALQLRPDSLLVKQMFLLADKDHNGFISYAEFIDVLVLLSKGSMDSKMRMLFDMYDLDGSGDLDEQEFKIMIKSLLEITNRDLNSEEVDSMVQGMLQQCNLHLKTLLNWNDFKLLIQKHQSVVWNDQKMQGLGLAPHADQKLITQEPIPIGVVDNKPVDRSYMSRKWNNLLYKIENNWSYIFLIVLYTWISIYLFLIRFMEYAYLKEHTGIRHVVGYGAAVSRGAANSISFGLAVLLLPVCRSLLTELRDTAFAYYVPIDSAIEVHRLVAISVLFYTVVHIVGHGCNFYSICTQPWAVLRCTLEEMDFPYGFRPTFHYWMFQTVTGITGVLLVLLFSLMYVFSLPYARKKIFKSFWLTHHLYPLIYILTVIHGSYRLLQPPFFYTYLVGPLVLFVFDRVMQLRRQRLQLRIAKAEALPSGVLHLSFKKPRSVRFSSGQWGRIACSELGMSEYHPFTITTAPHEKTIDFYIRSVGPWTTRINDLFSEKINNTLAFPKMYLQGPYGSSHQDWFKFETVVLVGAGIGVTPIASVLKDLVHKVNIQESDIATKNVYFLWLARTHTQFEWFVDILRQVEGKDANGLITVDIFITQLIKDFDIRTMMLYICEHHFQRLSNRSLFTGLRARTSFGRPNFQQYLFGVQRRNPQVSKVGVFSCGPKSVVRSVDAACQTVNMQGNSPLLIAHHEIF